ncbi:hypothetical protein J3U87_21080 [Sulfidibacter corallicola]|uniref:Tetracyclin repressor-like C-terminal domain-containing protein n=1 Tax=Sulfidibacter corallicola TaxID=2818388 RepID=A0A8A4TDT3_SULCO|nr:hypothetical protein J3U87_21080 [Sulfidibacter corallicola]
MVERNERAEGDEERRDPSWKETFREAFLRYVAEHGRRPNTIYAFAKSLNATEADFFSCYNAFSALEKDVWLEFHRQTCEVLSGDSAFAEYSARERMLAYAYTLIEQLKPQRGFVLNANLGLDPCPSFLQTFRREFLEWASQLTTFAEEQGEFAERPLLKPDYPQLFWMLVRYLMQFWVRDESADYQETDEAIEKAVHAMFDTAQPNFLDSWFDLGKLMLRQFGSFR